MPDGAQGKYGIGRVFGDGFAVLRRSPGVILGLVVGFALLGFAISYGAFLPAMGGAGQLDPAAPPQLNTGAFGGGYLLLLAIGAVQYPTLIHAGVVTLEGGRPSIARSLAHGVRRAPPFFLLTLLLLVSLLVSALLLLVPALILMVRWSAAPQALTMERTGVLESFGRSAQLTRGARWRTFLLFVLSNLALLPLFAIYALAVGQAGLTALTDPVFLIPYVAFSTLVGAYFVGLISAHYVELRRIHGQAAPERLAEVFA